ncbi:hypothetical protein VTI28DRAFT_9066 [Corynascus sepedonium]
MSQNEFMRSRTCAHLHPLIPFWLEDNGQQTASGAMRGQGLKDGFAAQVSNTSIAGQPKLPTPRVYSPGIKKISSSGFKTAVPTSLYSASKMPEPS